VSDWVNKSMCKNKIFNILEKYDPITDEEHIIFYNVLESILDCDATDHLISYLEMSRRGRKQ